MYAHMDDDGRLCCGDCIHSDEYNGDCLLLPWVPDMDTFCDECPEYEELEEWQDIDALFDGLSDKSDS